MSSEEILSTPPTKRRPGRPKGSRTKRRALLLKIEAERNISPGEVMLQNMWYWHSEAPVLIDKLEKLVARVQTDPQTLAKFVKMLAQMRGDARMHAQQCAVAAARYVHPRLARIKAGNESNIPYVIADDAGADGSVPVSGSKKRPGGV